MVSDAETHAEDGPQGARAGRGPQQRRERRLPGRAPAQGPGRRRSTRSPRPRSRPAIKDVREALTSEDPAEINVKTEALQAAFHKVSEAMYEKAQAEQAAAGANGGRGRRRRRRRRRRGGRRRRRGRGRGPARTMAEQTNHEAAARGRRRGGRRPGAGRAVDDVPRRGGAAEEASADLAAPRTRRPPRPDGSRGRARLQGPVPAGGRRAENVRKRARRDVAARGGARRRAARARAAARARQPRPRARRRRGRGGRRDHHLTHGHPPRPAGAARRADARRASTPNARRASRSTRTATRPSPRARRRRRARHRHRGLPARLPLRRRRCCARPRWSCPRRRCSDGPRRPLQDPRGRQEGVPGGDQEGAPQARAPVPPGPQPGRRQGRGALQGDPGRLRRPGRPGEAQAVRPRRARSAASAARVAPAAAAPAASTLGGFGDILSNLFGGGWRRAARGSRPAVRAPRPSAAATSRPRSRSPSTQAMRRRAGAADASRRPQTCPTCRGTGAKPGTSPEGLPAVPGARHRVPGPGPVLDLAAVLALRRRRDRHRGPVPDLPGRRRQQRTVKKYSVNIPAGVKRGLAGAARRQGRGRAATAARPATST